MFANLSMYVPIYFFSETLSELFSQANPVMSQQRTIPTMFRCRCFPDNCELDQLSQAHQRTLTQMNLAKEAMGGLRWWINNFKYYVILFYIQIFALIIIFSQKIKIGIHMFMNVRCKPTFRNVYDCDNTRKHSNQTGKSAKSGNFHNVLHCVSV